MKDFAALFAALDATTSTKKKTDALLLYFRRAQPADAAWALYFLAGGKPRQTVPTALVRAAARECAGIPEWLFDESYDVVGDLAETVAHVLPPPSQVMEVPLHVWVEERLLALRGQAPESISAALKRYWDELDTPGRFLLTKLIGGSFRVGVARRASSLRALAEATGIDAKLLAQRLMGYTDKQPCARRRALCVAAGRSAHQVPDQGRVGPALPLLPRASVPGARSRRWATSTQWQVEWKWDGIRAQFIRRGAELVVVVARRGSAQRPFPRDRRDACGCFRTTRCSTARSSSGATAACSRSPTCRSASAARTVTKKILADLPVAFLAYDLLEAGWRRHSRMAAMATPGAAGAGRSRRAPRAVRAMRCSFRRLSMRPIGHRVDRAARASRERAASKASCSSSARAATVRAAPRTSAPGGSGRSIRTASTPC